MSEIVPRDGCFYFVAGPSGIQQAAQYREQKQAPRAAYHFGAFEYMLPKDVRTVTAIPSAAELAAMEDVEAALLEMVASHDCDNWTDGCEHHGSVQTHCPPCRGRLALAALYAARKEAGDAE